MIKYNIFEQWFMLASYLSVAILLFFLPIINFQKLSILTKNTLISLLAIFLILSIATPFLVEIPNNETDKILSRSARIVQVYGLVLWYFVFLEKEIFTEKIKYFYWFIYANAIYIFLEILLKDILVNINYGFVQGLLPIFKILGITKLIFTSPLSYLIKFIFLSLFFRDLMKELFWKKFFQGAVLLFIVFELGQVFVFKSYQGYDSLSSTVKNIFIILSVGWFLYKFYHNDVASISLQKNPYFWISLGLLLPALAELFLEFIFSKLYQTDTASFYKLYLIRNASQMVGFLLLMAGVWQAKYLKYLPKSY